MYLRMTKDGPVKYSLTELRNDNPSTSFPAMLSEDTLSSYGVYRYTRPQAPEYDITIQSLEDGVFEQDAVGNWSLPFVITLLPLDVAETHVRSKRNITLSQSDWVITRAYERGEPVPQEWAAYRQALRDLPQQDGFPYNVTWPEAPAS